MPAPLNRKMQAFRSRRDGNVAIMTALVLPACISVLAIGVDYGHLTLERREMQVAADLTAIAVASDMAHAEAAALSHIENNRLNLLLKTPQGLKTPSGVVVPEAAIAGTTGRVTLEKGRYVANAALDADQRFQPGVAPSDAVRVTVEQPGTLFFASMFTTPPLMSAVGTAAMTKTAAFSIGSRLASLEGGLLNAILGKMLGTTLDLKAVDYRALATADLDLFQLTRGLASDLNLTAVTYDEILATDITVPQLLTAILRHGGLPSSTTTLVSKIRQSLPASGKRLSLARLIDLGNKGHLRIDAPAGLGVKVGVLDLLQSSAALANGAELVKVDTKLDLPGLGSVDLALAIGEPPVGTPLHRVGEPGQAVRTAQVRVALAIKIDGLADLLGIKISLPLYIEVAHAEAKLAGIQCHGGKPSNATVTIDTVPGVAEVSIGQVDAAALKNFGSSPRVTKAKLVESGLLTVEGLASVDVGSAQVRKLTFTPGDIAVGTTKNVSSSGLLTSLTQSLLANLEAEIRLPLLSLMTDKVVQAALAKTLGAVTPSIDALLERILAVAGVRIGEADVRVTQVDCANPVLVQ
ncbi:putative membrane protein [Rhizobium sp. PP-F2F-G38]|nr:putative membrane protein [Rhizobium sp. PP-WC-1G-195]PYE96729.1 putative membrane protein [Rhizobium sp. PP-F2F-G38]TCP86141.1 putative membrane protein [Rhizobium sp. PP-CC-2G-626]TCQ23586.1 putative membrane protein [Rhizobium sp. PP-CC-3G-465]